ncbi:MAG TPA: ATP-binding cassette domain-containing protein [Burkholderiales bacterium]|nr:ATP-binding cassette domain-containing protein [Burkholderiales bacterium]
MFSLQNLTHAYNGTAVLNVASWQAEQGAQWLMLGPSGSGKTTLLHVLAGILRPTSGQVTVADQDLIALSPSALDHFRGKHIGIVLQRLHLIDSLSVMNNLLLAQYMAGEAQDAARVREVLASLDLADKASAHPHELSHGQAQRVAVARAVVNKPKLLLADEPTSNLDDTRCVQVLDLLQAQARACGATLVIATHDQRIKARVANQYELSSPGSSAKA